MLEISSVKEQRKIIKGEHHYYQVKLENGKILDLESPIHGVAFEPDIEITKKNKFLTRLTTRIVPEDADDREGMGNGTSIQS